MKSRLILSLLALLAFNHMVHAELVFDISEEIVSPTQTNLLITAGGLLALARQKRKTH